MGPHLLVDTSSLVNRIHAPIARGSMPATCAGEHATQMKALLTGTLLFLPFLAAYLTLSCQQ